MLKNGYAGTSALAMAPTHSAESSAQGKPLLLINIDETPIPYYIKPVTEVVKKGFGGQIEFQQQEARNGFAFGNCLQPAVSSYFQI